jgi:hypothetical protein
VDQPQQRFAGTTESTVLTIATTEHYNLQTARAISVSETVGRAGMFLTTVSTTLVALAFAGDVTHFGRPFLVLGLVSFLSLLFLGVVTFERVVQASIEDVAAAQRINRLRRLYLELVPELGGYLQAPVASDLASAVLRGEGKRPNRWQLVLTVAGMVGVINSVIAGVVAGALTSRVVPGVLWASVAVGAVVFVAGVAIHQRVQRVWRTRAPGPFPSD